MPSHRHEALIELFRQRPSLADPLGLDPPTYQHALLDSGDLTSLVPTEYRADAVVTLTTDEVPTLAVVVEVQLRRDRAKRRSWPVYLTTLHARLRCPTILLVICPDRPTARWCATPILIGHPGFTLTPLALGPDQVPVLTDASADGASPELAVLSAMAHSTHPDRDKILYALLKTLDTMEADHAALYADVVLAALPEAARHHLEALMSTTYQYQSDFARRYFQQGRSEGKAEGKAEGEARALLRFLAARGIAVPEHARTRIADCTDLELLDTWVRRAATAETVDDLFR
ncbi:hypothetical protein JQS43_23235 [Natronosporangium hydrolyticum]|uniref:DUF4351 domain-containing protein n=1 Tax=Natronosporangium hydrolyticum TaxID=2811111 RepID=A0A895YG41_9ACTN|nr:hypothetical protein [Natronosporangium hydrolyticum]QSB14373.1 hypothetical protein JQS43_23235 [Natronosporangium hydrolyticum]